MATRRDGEAGGMCSPIVFPLQDTCGTIERVAELLEATYRSAHLGNITDDVLAETVYILLTLQTQEPVYQRVLGAMRKRFPTWLEVMNASLEDLEAVLRTGGLQHQRVVKLQDLLQAVHADNMQRGVGPAAGGDLTLEHLRDLGAPAAERFLLGLPGIGVKSARCIESYALGGWCLS